MEENLSIIYNYYPKHIYASDLKYPYTPENIRQWELIENTHNTETENNYFEDMAEMLAGYMNCDNQRYFSLRGIFDLSRTVVLHLPDNPHHKEYPYCIISISVIAKYYSAYFTKFAGVPINTLKRGNLSLAQNRIIDNFVYRLLVSYYPGYGPFPMEYFNTKVPDVYSAKDPLNFATYYECLITDCPL